jgi:hypothetical protein
MSVSGGMMMQDGSHMMQQPMSGGAQRVMQNVMQFQTQEQEIVERVPVQWQERRRRVPVQVPVMVQKEVMVQQVVQPVYIPYREEVYYPPPPPPEYCEVVYMHAHSQKRAIATNFYSHK